jgi:polysaccharide export outer membrane protein
MKAIRLSLAQIALLVALVSAFPAQQEKKTQAAPTPKTDENYVIGLQDVLSVFVWREPELSVREVAVTPDGKISLPLINEVQASGLTTKQLREQLAEKLKDFVASPNVSVVVLKSLSQSVTIMGEVGRPGAYGLGAPMTVLDLLARAGGFTEMAKRKEIKIVRNEGGKTVQFLFNYKEAIKGKKLDQNITLRNGDIVLVP